MEKKNELAVAGDQLLKYEQAGFEIAKWIGRQQAFGLIANKCSAAQAEVLKRLKDSGAHKDLGLTRDEFCDQHLGISRQTVDRIIANYEEFGAAYFAMSNVMRISPQTYRMLAPAVDAEKNELVFGDEKIPITKANTDRILDAVSAIRKDAETARQQVYDAKSDLKKAREERDNARKAAEKTREEMREMQRKDERMFERAEGDHRQMLTIQSRFDFAMLQLSGLGAKELAPADQARIIGLGEYMFRSITQVMGAIRERYGLGWNAPEPGDTMIADDMTPHARNLMAEYVDSGKSK